MPTTKKVKRSRSRFPDRKHFAALRPYIDKIARGTLGRHHYFSLCVRASISKCFEFNLLARNSRRVESAFFAMAALRGICEDLIVLRFVGRMPTTDREALIQALIQHEMATRASLQVAFFSAFRPQQPVLSPQDAEKQISVAEIAAQAIWNRHGWPNMKSGAVPQIRQIAEKQGIPLLLVLYDYLYRLTSASVHFNVQTLLRSGWGSIPQVRFSTKNFYQYYSAYCSVYGAFMLCLYFEFFGPVLRPPKKVANEVAKIRMQLLHIPRWPEMLTYEEMNLEPPAASVANMVFSSLQAVMRKRLLSHTVDYRTERRLAAMVLRSLASDIERDAKSTAGKSGVE